MKTVTIVDSGVANVASVRSALTALGYSSRVSTSSKEILASSHVVLPGVGSFSVGMESLRGFGLTDALKEYAASGGPLLGICLGMQMLCDGSEESPGVAGLGIIPGRCRRISDSVRVPQLGWNRVSVPSGSMGPVEDGEAAFANSYALFAPPSGWEWAKTHYGTRFVSALWRDSVLAVQFHPELSGTYGLSLLGRWLTGHSSADTVKDPRTGKSGWKVRAATIPSGQHRRRSGLPRIIPCLDVKEGRVVKGIRFQELRDAGDPGVCARRYADDGADEIVMLDINASPAQLNTHIETVRRVRAAIHIPLSVGGGVRSTENARRLLSAGADKVCINSAAVVRPKLLTELSSSFGRQCTVLAIDARLKNEGWEVLTMGGRRTALPDVIEWALMGERLGAGEILLTSWDRDGTLSGVDEELIRRVSSAVSIPVIASGGIGTTEHAASAFRAGATAVLAASIFHDGMMSVDRVKRQLSTLGIGVRI